MMQARRDIGETLVEVLLTVVIVGLTVTSLLSSLGTTSKAGAAQRVGVQSDVVMRNYAEATKAAVQLQCVATGGTYTVGFVQPTGYRVSGAGSACPSPSATTLTALQLTVIDPLGRQLLMWIKVRTP